MRYVNLVGVTVLACTAALAQPVPKVESFFGYSYVRFNSAGPVPAVSSNGGNTQIVYNFNSRIGLVGDIGGYHKGDVHGFYSDNTTFTITAGPRFSFAKRHRVNPYLQGLFGVVSSTALAGFAIRADPLLPQQGISDWSYAMLLGGGVDIKLGRHVAFRPLEVNYFLSRADNPLMDSRSNQSNLRASAGISFLLGGEKPAPPPPPPVSMHVCPDGKSLPVGTPCPKLNLGLAISAPMEAICPNESVRLSVTNNANRNGLTYKWSVQGQPVAEGAQFDFAGTGRGPGSYEIGVSANGADINPAMAKTAITVKEYQPPTGTVTAVPAEIVAGEKSAVTASFTGQCGGTIRPPTFTASEGTIVNGEFDSSGVQFDANMTGEQRKSVTITASAADDQNTGTANTMVTVIKKASVAAIRLPDVLFPKDSSRVNNCGKRILLEQLRSYFERDPEGKAVLSGHNGQNETMKNLAQDRVANAAALVTVGSGVCLSIPAAQVMVNAPGADQGGVTFEPGFCGPSTAAGATPERPGQAVKSTDKAAEFRRVVVWFVPSGGQMPANVGDTNSAASLNLSGCPK